jgi:hypothetical protein
MLGLGTIAYGPTLVAVLVTRQTPGAFLTDQSVDRSGGMRHTGPHRQRRRPGAEARVNVVDTPGRPA